MSTVAALLFKLLVGACQKRQTSCARKKVKKTDACCVPGDGCRLTAAAAAAVRLSPCGCSFFFSICELRKVMPAEKCKLSIGNEDVSGSRSCAREGWRLWPSHCPQDTACQLCTNTQLFTRHQPLTRHHIFSILYQERERKSSFLSDINLKCFLLDNIKKGTPHKHRTKSVTRFEKDRFYKLTSSVYK